MTKTILIIAGTLVLLSCGAAFAQDEAALGKSHFTVELDGMLMQHRTWIPDAWGVYTGVAGYYHLGDNWYLGGELGVGGGPEGEGLIGSTTYVPLEVNVMRATGVSQHWIFDFGAGLSYSRIKYDYGIWSLLIDQEEAVDWVFGGQILCNWFYRTGRLLLGLKLKYQLTTNMSDLGWALEGTTGWDYTNFKIGLELGFVGSE